MCERGRDRDIVGREGERRGREKERERGREGERERGRERERENSPTYGLTPVRQTAVAVFLCTSLPSLALPFTMQ